MSNKLKEIYNTLKLVMPEYGIELQSEAVQIYPKDSQFSFQSITINVIKQGIYIEVFNMNISELEWMFNIEEISMKEAFKVLVDYGENAAPEFDIYLGKGCSVKYYRATLKDNYEKRR